MRGARCAVARAFHATVLPYAQRGSAPALFAWQIWARHADISKQWSVPLTSILKRTLRLKADDRPEACDIIKDPALAPALQSGTLHPKALRHQKELAEMTASPTCVQEAQLHSARSRPTSAPPEMSKYPPSRSSAANRLKHCFG